MDKINFSRLLVMTGVILTALLFLESDAEAAHCTGTPEQRRCPPCPRTYPGPHPSAAAGWIYVCQWRDGCHFVCGQIRIKVKRTTKRFKNCRDAAIWVAQQRTIADITPRFSPVIGPVNYKTNPDGTIIAETTVTWNADVKNTIISMTSVSWSNMTNADREAAKNFSDAILGHESGHMIVGESVVNDFSGSQKSDPAGSKQAALVNLQEKLNDLRSAAQENLDRQAGVGGEYDQVTDHGRSQSAGPPRFPGGANINLVCP